MSAPPKTDAAAAARPKPKRPLSGYNLFYRYKRNKILEATARPDADNEANIRAVLTALPGLEGVDPASPLFRLPPAKLNEFRSAVIRKEMEGKLFPNENARSRVHRKVHGMGFVEMGKTMRLMWGEADKLAKDVFCELADVGRVRYKRLVAEYKLSIEHEVVHSKSPPVGESAESSVSEKTARPRSSLKPGEAKVAAKFSAARKAAAAAVLPPKKRATAALPERAPSSSPAPSAEPESERIRGPGHKRRVSTDRGDPAGGPPAIPLYRRAAGDVLKPLSAGYRRQVSRELDGPRGGSLFDSVPAEAGDEPGTPKTTNGRKFGRGASRADIPSVPTGIPEGGAAVRPRASRPAREGPRTDAAMQSLRLREAIERMRDQIAENNRLLPPEMRVHYPQDRKYGGRPRLGGPVAAPGGRGGEVSAHDFMEFIGDLDEVLDYRRPGAAKDSSEGPRRVSVPVSAAVEQKTSGSCAA